MSQVKLHGVTTNNINCSPSLLLSMIVTSSESGTGLLSFRNGGTFTVTSNGTLQYHTHATAAAHSTSYMQVVDANDMVISTNPDNSTTGNVAVIQLMFSSMAQQPGHLPHTAISNSTPTVNRSMFPAPLCYSWCQLCTVGSERVNYYQAWLHVQGLRELAFLQCTGDAIYTCTACYGCDKESDAILGKQHEFCKI